MTNIRKLLLTSSGVLLLGVTQANAASVPIYQDTPGGLFNTGVDASGTPLANGATDSHYVIAASVDGGPLPEITLTSSGGWPVAPAGPWLGDDGKSDWDSESNGTFNGINHNGGEGSGTFHNVITFNAPVSGVLEIAGNWAVDDSGTEILLDGQSTGNTNLVNNFSSFTPFSITATVTAGSHTLDFEQVNGGTPGGVRVEFTGASVPEPASLSLLGLGGLSLHARRRKA